MSALTLAGLRERWPLLLGALLSVAAGTALLASAMTVADSATRPGLAGLDQRQAFAVRDAFDAVAAIMIISAMLTGLLTVFIVATTFAFAVAERRRDIALLRLLGAGRGQVRLVLLGEALALGTAGSAIGLALTGPAVSAQMWLLRRADFVPGGFELGRPSWPLWTAGGVGVAVALLGVLAASRRASLVPPLEAVRGGGARDRTMTAGRWTVGVLMLLATAAQIAAAARVGLVVALALGMGVALTGAIAASRLAPAVMPLAARALGAPLRPTALGSLVDANGREGVQRSAATAAPVIVLVALVVSVTSALAATATATAVEARDRIDADLVVTTTGAEAAVVAALPGVAAASPESTPDLFIDLPQRTGGGIETERRFDGYAVVDPAGYAALHPVAPVAGSLADLDRDHIAVMERPTDGIGFELGDPATVTVGAQTVPVRIAAILPEQLSTGQQILLHRDLVPDDLLDTAPTDVLVEARSHDDVAAVRAAAEPYGDTAAVEEWITARTEAAQRTNDATLEVLLALSGLYTVMAVANAVVIAGTGRRREHAVARLSGLTRRQVVAATALEAAVTAVTGLVLGLAVAACAVLGIALAARRSVGSAVVEIPWTLLTATAAGSLGLAVAVSALVAALVTRTDPITVAAARE
ncbi:FtsX-like permease family protein [Glycomyces sp. A-F 0318]|uniref:FtsX-like permease family protein n=1 Tax=Glycomyces amatae TaxID=2881355 RepID=UPI001E5BEE90|nr:FtsX-like permease family protein [Glycomyces amatae]MCD0443673.1 FtsX-like permease family protein [Glycomyces amatae]